jgi:hypothetical protein
MEKFALPMLEHPLPILLTTEFSKIFPIQGRRMLSRPEDTHPSNWKKSGGDSGGAGAAMSECVVPRVIS